MEYKIFLEEVIEKLNRVNYSHYNMLSFEDGKVLYDDLYEVYVGLEELLDKVYCRLDEFEGSKIQYGWTSDSD